MTRRKERPFEWITSAEASNILQISERHVRRLGVAGKIATIQLNPRMKLFLKADVEAYTVQRRRSEAKEEANAA